MIITNVIIRIRLTNTNKANSKANNNNNKANNNKKVDGSLPMVSARRV